MISCSAPALAAAETGKHTQTKATNHGRSSHTAPSHTDQALGVVHASLTGLPGVHKAVAEWVLQTAAALSIALLDKESMVGGRDGRIRPVRVQATVPRPNGWPWGCGWGVGVV